MRNVLENTDNLTIKQGEVAEVIVEDGKVTGVRTTSDAIYPCSVVIMCTGTYLKARCIYGDVSQYTGPNGLSAANSLSQSLLDLGIELRRFKTGTPARVDKRTIDFSKMEEQKGDEKLFRFRLQIRLKSWRESRYHAGLHTLMKKLIKLSGIILTGHRYTLEI